MLEQLAALSALDWIAFVTGLAYVVLAARDNDWCWVFAVLSTGIWAYLSIVQYHLVSDGMLQVFYMIMAGIGLRRWQRERKGQAPEAVVTDTLDADLIQGKPAPNILRMTLEEHILVIICSTAVGYILHLVVSANFQAVATLPDAITTVFSVSATFLLIYRKLENWLYWIVIDVVYIWIYWRTGALLFSVLMVVYVIVAIYGYLNWRTLRGVEHRGKPAG